MTAPDPDSTVEQLAYVIRDEAYPEFRHAPPPEWASRAARRVIEYHQPLIRDEIVQAAVRAALEGLRADLWTNDDLMKHPAILTWLMRRIDARLAALG